MIQNIYTIGLLDTINIAQMSFFFHNLRDFDLSSTFKFFDLNDRNVTWLEGLRFDFNSAYQGSLLDIGSKRGE